MKMVSRIGSRWWEYSGSGLAFLQAPGNLTEATIPALGSDFDLRLPTADFVMDFLANRIVAVESVAS